MRFKMKNTIFKRLFIPLFTVMIVQSAIFYGITAYGNILSTLNENAEDILIERVENRKNEIETKFNTSWKNMDPTVQAIDSLYNTMGLTPDIEGQKEFLLQAASSLVKMIRDNNVNGAFLILNAQKTIPTLMDTPQSYYGLCIRDYDPDSEYTNKEDLLVIRSPSTLVQSMDIPLDSFWESQYTFSTQGNLGDFFYKPLQAAYENPGVSSDNLAYLAMSHSYAQADYSVLSYSIPLVGEDGTIYGVLGFELTKDYLESLLPSDEILGTSKGSYLILGGNSGSDTYQIDVANGIVYQRAFDDEFAVKNEDGEIFSYNGKNRTEVIGYKSPIIVYNRNTPFEEEEIFLAGVVLKKDLYSVSSDVQRSLVTVTFLVLFLGIVGIFVVSHWLSLPIRKLAKNVEESDINNYDKLEHINILEIDHLVDAIEEQSKKINQAKARTEFFSRMSHDMRTPMNAIIGFSSNEVTQDSSPEELLDDLAKINNSGHYLLGLINEVLDITKIDSGKMEIENKSFSLKDLWERTLPMIDELAVRRKIDFVKSIPNDDCFVMGDVQRISQIIMNLLSNAIKFTPEEGKVFFTAGINAYPNQKINLSISVKDTGIGMSKEFLEKLYQPFTQEHPNQEGTGLGLSIAYQLVECMKGSMECNSKLNQGTEFIVRIPLRIAQNGEAERVSKGLSALELKEILHGKRILICEDHPMNQQIVIRLLKQFEMEIEVAENGKIGLEMFENSKEGTFDLILMDIRMPLMDGLETTRKIRALKREDAKKIPILAMTANAFNEDIDASKAAGMNAHLSKPIEPQKMYQTIAKFISLRQSK